MAHKKKFLGQKSQGQLLHGKLLIAMPHMHDASFEASVVFICAHGSEGAFGLIINKPAPLMSFADLVDKIDYPSSVSAIKDEILHKPVLYGGPVEKMRGFVLHSADYKGDEMTLKIGKSYRLTATVDVLRDIAEENGPKKHLVALGYSGWSPGQLENEIMHNGWLHCDCDDELLFGENLPAKYNLAMSKIGIDPRMMSSDVGHG